MDQDSASSGDPAADLATLLRDWITVWQSEMAAMTVDREMQEHTQALVDFWAGAAQGFLQQAFASRGTGTPQSGADAQRSGSGDERSAGRARAAATPGAPAAAAAPDHGDDEIQRLRARVAELEQRIAVLERPRQRSRRTTRA
jgi:hypothetical protein